MLFARIANYYIHNIPAKEVDRWEACVEFAMLIKLI